MTKAVASMLLPLNFCMYAIVLAIAAWATNKAIVEGFFIGPGLDLPPQFSPISFSMGNGATGFFVVFSLIAGVFGVASIIVGIHHWNGDTDHAAATSAAAIALTLTALAMGFAWKEIELQNRNAKLRTMEAFLIILTVTQLLYIAAICRGSAAAAKFT
ncbi:unnamed protein product [Cuscuta europaea]|uniref:Uncharacterized protein n=1 Tax=Cuscuta europaea TaxID=41803 RepID=A0A9P0YHE1_CUSEU|nr:unnamed protein product [Cuscuta europaea]